MMTRGLLVMSLLSLWVGWILADVSVQEDPLDDMDPARNQMNLIKEQVVDDQNDENGPQVAISVSRRSPLDKNFIRFGRFGPKLMAVDTARLTSSGEYEGEGGANGGRASRGLSSNFIRFGRSFDPYRLRDLILKEIEEQEKQTDQQSAYQRMERSLASNFLRFGRSIH